MSQMADHDDAAAYAQAAGLEEPPVPGTGESDQGPPQEPPTGVTTDTTPAGQEPGPVPYSRFKEVNDRRRMLEDQIQPVVALEQQGYDAANLQRLVAWEQEYLQDPVETWLTHAESIVNLPDPVKQAIAAVRDGAAKGNVPADGTPPDPEDDGGGDEIPEWGQELLNDRRARVEREEREAQKALMDAMMGAWESTNKELGIPTPNEQTRLIYLQAAASQEGTPGEIFVRAHKAWMDEREATLQAEVRPPATGTVPHSVPGSGGAAPGASPVQPRTLREATKAARLAEEQGKLIMQ